MVDGSETARVELGGDDRTMVLDVAYGRAAREAITAMHEQLRHGHADPPELESRTARVTYTPAALADLGFLAGIVEAEGAARSVDPTQRARMIAGQLGIVRDALALARTDKGVILDRVELGITDDDAKLEVTVSAEPGPAFVRIPDEVWIPSTTVTAADGKEVYDISRALLGAWPLPTECKDPLAPGEAVRCDFDVNEAPYFVALPHLFALSALAVTNSHQSHASSLLSDQPCLVALGWLAAHRENPIRIEVDQRCVTSLDLRGTPNAELSLREAPSARFRGTSASGGESFAC
ncbi:MAG TPA: hypothetical protein VF316_20820 [Polyangiaceae bacterium]